MWALYAREVKRFRNLWMDTVFSPIISMGLYLAVFGVVTKGQVIGEIGYLPFVYSGLLAMTMVNGSFSNPAFALLLAKNVGTIIDLQIVPLRAWKVGVAYALAALTRGIVTLAIALLFTVWFVPGLSLAHPFVLLTALLLTGFQFGILGVIIGFSVKAFEGLTFAMTFVLQPMIFLAGVFYPISTLPHPWNIVSTFNPVHHNVNLFRYGLTGYSDIFPWISLVVTAGLSMIFFVIMHVRAQKTLQAS
jgi:ABC-2 type transport system permease protein